MPNCYFWDRPSVNVMDTSNSAPTNEECANVQSGIMNGVLIFLTTLAGGLNGPQFFTCLPTGTAMFWGASAGCVGGLGYTIYETVTSNENRDRQLQP